MIRKILLVTFSDNADHQDVMIGMYEQLLKQCNIEPFLLLIKAPKVPFCKDKNIWLVNCPKRPGITRKTFNVFLLAKIIHRIRKEKFDVMYFESLHIWNLPIILFKLSRTKVFHVIHEVIPHEGDKQTKMVFLMNKIICKLANTIILHNHKYVNTLVNMFNVNINRIKVIDCWRRYPTYIPPKYSKRFLFFGRINPYKGADYLLQIIKKCPELHFDIVGRTDPLSHQIIDSIKKYSNVTVIDKYVTDNEMELAFINSDWVILPYKSASQSGVIIDSYKYSRPVVAFNVGAISEQVKDNVSGYLVSPGNTDIFSDKLKFLSGIEKNKYKKLTQQAYEFGKSKYAAEGNVELFLKIIFSD